MREIIFRGLTIKGKWVYGLLSQSTGKQNQPDEGYYISNSAGSPWAYQIRPETIGQYTGFNDIEDEKIFEGDIITPLPYTKAGLDKYKWLYVAWDMDRYYYHYKRFDGMMTPYIFGYNDVLIMGNIHENPELLGRE